MGKRGEDEGSVPDSIGGRWDATDKQGGVRKLAYVLNPSDSHKISAQPDCEGTRIPEKCSTSSTFCHEDGKSRSGQVNVAKLYLRFGTCTGRDVKEKEEKVRLRPSGMGDREEPAVFRGAPARGKDVDNCNTSPFSFVESNGATYQIPYIKGKTYEPDFCEEHFHKPQKGSRHKFLYVQQGKKTEKDINLDDTYFNVDPAVRLYSCWMPLFLYHNRAFFNPPLQPQDMYWWVRSLRDDQVDELLVQTMAESFMSARGNTRPSTKRRAHLRGDGEVPSHSRLPFLPDREMTTDEGDSPSSLASAIWDSFGVSAP